MVGEVEAAIEAGAFGLSSGLIYAPGVHAGPHEMAALVGPRAAADALYSTHMRNEAAGLFEALDEALTAVRASGEGGRLQVSHLKCGSRSVWGRADEAVGVLEAARDEGVDVAADQYPYTAAATTLAIVAAARAAGPRGRCCVAALRDPGSAAGSAREIDRGSSGWENVARDPGWSGVQDLARGESPGLGGPLIAELGDALGAEPAELAFDALMDDRLDVSVVHRVHVGSRRRDDHGRALDRGLHGRRGPPARSSDPRRGTAASAHLRIDRPGPRRYVRERGTLRSRGRSRSSPPCRPRASGARPRGGQGGRVRRPGRVRSGHGR